ncbi:hypothetical protein DFP73DRAFT_564710 [Morchella snyderi]|nr:hypothetical protein DFP73DRAFT_564710 [Morchella snyderi]
MHISLIIFLSPSCTLLVLHPTNLSFTLCPSIPSPSLSISIYFLAFRLSSMHTLSCEIAHTFVQSFPRRRLCCVRNTNLNTENNSCDKVLIYYARGHITLSHSPSLTVRGRHRIRTIAAFFFMP